MSKDFLISEIQRMVRSEVESSDLQRAPFRSYRELVEYVLKEISRAKDIDSNDVKLIVRHIALLAQKRMMKILDRLADGEEIREEKLFAEEIEILRALLRLREALHVREERREPRLLSVISFKTDLPVIRTSRFSRVGPFRTFDILAIEEREVLDLIKRDVVKVVRQVNAGQKSRKATS